MSELTTHLRRMLSQAQVFASEAPHEALARTKRLVAEANRALEHVGDSERDEVLSILALAKKRIARYEKRLEEFQAQNAQRAALFAANERKRLEQPIPPKV